MAKEKKTMFVLPMVQCEMDPFTKARLIEKMDAYRQIYNRLVAQVNRALRNNEELLKEYKAKKIKKHELLNSLTIDYEYDGKEKYFGVTEYAMNYAANAMIKEDMGGGKKYNSVLNTKNVAPISTEIVKAVNQVIAEYDGKETPKLKIKKICNVITFGFCVSNGKFMGINSVDLANSTIDVKNAGMVKYHINDKHYYEMFAMGNKMKQVCFVRKEIRGKEKMYVQFVFEGVPYMKGVELGKGMVSIDIGPRTFYVLYKKEDGTFGKMELNLSNLENIDREKNNLQRKIDRSRRATTPENYNENGTAKKKGERVRFRDSNRNKKSLAELKDIFRKLTAKKEIEENRIVNTIIALGNDFRIEYTPGMIKSWTARAKESHVKPNGRNSSKKRYGKSVLNSAPHRFLEKLERKVTLLGGTVTEIPTKWGCTGFDHTDGSYTKHERRVREVTLSNGNKHHRDFHSCFNIMFANPEKEKTFDIDQMNENYPAYCQCDLVF